MVNQRLLMLTLACVIGSSIALILSFIRYPPREAIVTTPYNNWVGDRP